MKSTLPAVFAFVLVFAFALMLVSFRSLVIAAKAILLNLLSVAAAYGVLVLVFQHGVGQGWLGFSSTAGIDPVVPLLLFVILFGLSMDYHVLVLGPDPRGVLRRCQTMDEAISVRDQAHGRCRHQRGDRDGRRVLDLRGALAAVLQAVRRRARDGDPDRRDDRPRGAPARVDEAAGRLELVPALVAPVASPARAARRPSRA